MMCATQGKLLKSPSGINVFGLVELYKSGQALRIVAKMLRRRGGSEADEAYLREQCEAVADQRVKVKRNFSIKKKSSGAASKPVSVQVVEGHDWR